MRARPTEYWLHWMATTDIARGRIMRKFIFRAYVDKTRPSLVNWSHLFALVQFFKCWQFFLEVNSETLYRNSGKERGSRFLVFLSSKLSEMMHFHVVVVQRRQRNVQCKKAWSTSKVVVLLIKTCWHPICFLAIYLLVRPFTLHATK